MRQDLGILPGRICTKKARIKGGVSGDGGQVITQQAIIDEMKVGITILHGLDDIIVQATGEILQRIYKQLAEIVKKQTLNVSTFLNHQKAIID